MWNDPRNAIIDRSIYEDAFIFARALNHLGNLNERDYETYKKVFERVVATLPPPSLLVYLRAPVPVLMKRIHSRGREMESGIDESYLQLLESYYDDWMKSFDLCGRTTWISSTSQSTSIRSWKRSSSGSPAKKRLFFKLKKRFITATFCTLPAYIECKQITGVMSELR
jgi:hypothetical protein